MAQFASDSFTGTGGTLLETYNPAWTRHTVGSTASIDARISNANRCRGVGSGGGAALYYHSGAPASADYSASADIYEASDAMYGAGVCVRMSTSANTFYMARWYGVPSPDVVQLFRFDAGAVTQLGSDLSADFTTGATRNLKLEAVTNGSQVDLKVYIDGSGTPSITYSDVAANRITATGKAGIRLGYGGSAAPSDTTCLHLDNFSADDVGGATNYTITAESGTFAVTGTAATLKFGHLVAASSGSVAVTGTASSLKLGRSLPAASGSVSVSGADAALEVGKLISASPGAFIVTGADATLTKSVSGAYTLNCNSGVFAVSGNAATLALGRILSASNGSVIVTGTTATLNAAKRILVSSGGFSVSGTDATLIYANLNHYTLDSAPGEIDVTGFSASLNFTPEVGDKTGGDDYPLRVVQKARKKTLAEQPGKHLESIIAKAVRDVFGESEEVEPKVLDVGITISEQKQEVVHKTPEFEGIKTLSVAEKEAEKVGELLDLYQQQVQLAQMQEDEDLLVLIMEMY